MTEMGNARSFRAATICYLLRSSTAWAPGSCSRCQFRGTLGLSTQYRRQRPTSTTRTSTKFWSKSASWEDDELWALDSGRVMVMDDVADMPISQEFEMLCYSQCQLLQDLVNALSLSINFVFQTAHIRQSKIVRTHTSIV